MTPVKSISSNTSPMKDEMTENETSMTPVAKIHSSTLVTPVQKTDAMLGTSPVCMKDAVISTSPYHGTDSTTNTSPICSTDSTQPHICTPIKSTCGTELNLSRNDNVLTPIREEHDPQLSAIHKEDAIDAIERNTINTSIKNIPVHVGTSMTPIELVDKQTLVSPLQTSNVSVTTSPLVAALQPEIISSLPLNLLRADLESAAISNELLRSECDDLNAKVEVLKSSLAEVRSEADKKCCAMQLEIENLQSKLDEALEINYQMEMKKVSFYFSL
jgi:hypothetical protein